MLRSTVQPAQPSVDEFGVSFRCFTNSSSLSRCLITVSQPPPPTKMATLASSAGITVDPMLAYRAKRDRERRT